MAPMEMTRRAKRVTEPLDDKAKTRLLGVEGYVSSGSDHDGGDLAGVVDGIFFSDEEGSATVEDNGGGVNPCEEFPPPAEAAAVVRGMVREAAEDPFAAALAAAAAAAAAERGGVPGLQRAVMGRLREAGYNAGLCKARWEVRGGGCGSYEYVDVLRDDTRQRYIVDVAFRGQFEIARPTAEYERVAALLPRVYVGRPEELRRLLRLLADAAKRSLQLRELHVPPWRKSQYMQAKWLGPYRRTTNPVSSAVAAAEPPAVAFAPGLDVKCRHVGFDTGPRVSILPALLKAR
ncbi:uncharacterized protein LOC144704675 [Wolffia australiana]